VEKEDGENIYYPCPVCSGTEKQFNYCFTCMGTGKLDWVEIIVGKKRNYFSKFTLPLIRTMFPKLVSSNLVNVQPMEEPKTNFKLPKPIFKKDGE